MIFWLRCLCGICTAKSAQKMSYLMLYIMCTVYIISIVMPVKNLLSEHKTVDYVVKIFKTITSSYSVIISLEIVFL